MHLDTPRYGGVVEAACRLFGYVLSKVEGLGPTKPAPGLAEIHADKTIRLFASIWRARGSDGSMQLPVVDVEDKHGPRVAFAHAADTRTGKPRSTVLRTMTSIDRRSPPAMRSIEVVATPIDGGTYNRIVPQVTTPMLEGLVRAGYISLEDIAFVERFADVCAQLAEDELIAVGRHETEEGTRDAILYELGRWWIATQECLDFMSNRPLDDIDDGWIKGLAYRLWRWWSFARECELKSGPERLVYEAGYSKFNACDAADVRDCFLEGRQTAIEIWDGIGVQRLRFYAHAASSVSDYIAGLFVNHADLTGHFLRPKVDPERVQEAFAWCRGLVGMSITEVPQFYEPGPLAPPADDPGLASPAGFWSTSPVDWEQATAAAADLKSKLSELNFNKLFPGLEKEWAEPEPTGEGGSTT